MSHREFPLKCMRVRRYSRRTEVLTIKDRSFNVTSATFDAILSCDDQEGWQLGWFFDVETEGVQFGDLLWRPRLYAEDLRLTVPDPRCLSGLRVAIPEAYD